MKQFKKRGIDVFISGGLLLIGFGLLSNHYMFWGDLYFFDLIPSHESIGGLLLFGGIAYIFGKMFKYKIPKWLKNKNKDKW